MSHFNRQFQDFGAWRAGVALAIARYRDWIGAHDLMNVGIEGRLLQTRERLTHDKLSVAFVAEFSRGKSELINAIFFAGYKQRILPSSAGRTTMCPTELRHDDDEPPALRLLPIETRATNESTTDLKRDRSRWVTIDLDVGSPEHMQEAFARVAETKRVPAAVARSYGLYDENDPDQHAQMSADGTVEISCWRHAVVNFPHPLLKQGLVIIDTPGLNAIGSEPELTLNLIPNADAVLFILAADTGVTKSDIEIWRKYIGGVRHGRLVALNKIDAMWDELRSPAQVERELTRQVADCARVLGLDETQLFPISAQKALIAKIHRDDALLDKSRLLALEAALADQLVPHRRQIISDQVARDVELVGKETHALLVSRARSMVEQLYELNSVRGKNAATVERTLERIQHEKEDFDALMRDLLATRAVFARLANSVYAALGMDVLRSRVADARARMLSSRFSLSLRDAMGEFLANVRKDLGKAQERTDEVHELMQAMYRRFMTEQGMMLPPLTPLRVKPYIDEIERVAERFEREFSTLRVLTGEQSVLIQKFFETVATRVKDVYVRANRDVEAWLKSVMAPIEIQARDQQRSLRKRLESVKRVHEASNELDAKIDELQEQQDAVEALSAEHGALLAQVRAQIFALSIPPATDDANAYAAA